VLPRYRFAQLIWVMLFMCGLFVVLSDCAEAEEALASWYGPGFDGKMTSSGQPFDAGGLTTAHPTLPIGTELMVSYEGKSVPVTVNDQGPYTGNRELDLSQGAAKALGLIKPGVDYVQVECANGGIYPNCTPVDTTPQNAPTLLSTPAVQDTNVQDGTTLPQTSTLQNSTTVQDGTALPNRTTFQDGTTLQDSTNVQDGAGSGTHVVQPGETLSGIAAQLGTSADYLSAHNGITDPNLIYVGQTLYF
jgi:rare lipoprotein A